MVLRACRLIAVRAKMFCLVACAAVVVLAALLLVACVLDLCLSDGLGHHCQLRIRRGGLYLPH